MTDHAEQLAIERAERIASARRLASEWGYWCVYGMWGGRSGRPPADAMDTLDRRYRPPPCWHPPEPAMPEANEPVGLAVQKAFAELPEVYRRPLEVEFCVRPWVVPLKEGEMDLMVARRARLSVGAYRVTLERALLAMVNVMKRKGLTRM